MCLQCHSGTFSLTFHVSIISMLGFLLLALNVDWKIVSVVLCFRCYCNNKLDCYLSCLKLHCIVIYYMVVILKYFFIFLSLYFFYIFIYFCIAAPFLQVFLFNIFLLFFYAHLLGIFDYMRISVYVTNKSLESEILNPFDIRAADTCSKYSIWKHLTNNKHFNTNVYYIFIRKGTFKYWFMHLLCKNKVSCNLFTGH